MKKIFLYIIFVLFLNLKSTEIDYNPTLLGAIEIGKDYLNKKNNDESNIVLLRIIRLQKKLDIILDKRINKNETSLKDKYLIISKLVSECEIALKVIEKDGASKICPSEMKCYVQEILNTYKEKKNKYKEILNKQNYQAFLFGGIIFGSILIFHI